MIQTKQMKHHPWKRTRPDETPLAPLKQINEGVEAEDIQCKSSLELIFKQSGEPACVKTSSVQKLVSWGWTQ